MKRNFISGNGVAHLLESGEWIADDNILKDVAKLSQKVVNRFGQKPETSLPNKIILEHGKELFSPSNLPKMLSAVLTEDEIYHISWGNVDLYSWHAEIRVRPHTVFKLVPALEKL